MGVYLDEILESVKKNPVAEQLRIICDKIFAEEIHHPKLYRGPQGPNIFLSLPAVKEETGMCDTHYVCLEREAMNRFIVSHWIKGKKSESPLKRVKVWPVRADTSKKILKEFGAKLLFVKGE